MLINGIRSAHNIREKRIFLRADYNVPMAKGKILDDFKIIASLPTIRFLLRYDTKIIIATHLGRPKSGDKECGTKPIAEHLSKLLGRKVLFAGDCGGPISHYLERNMRPGDILFLENLRLDKGEEKNDKVFAKKLASLADIYVNNAFAVSHRKHASLNAIAKFIPSYAGLLLEDELNSLNKILKPKKPLIVILGGAKIETKIPLINMLSKKAYKILIGGALANNFFVAHGFNIGKSIFNKENIGLAKKLKEKNLILPIDVVVGKKLKGQDRTMVKKPNDIKNDEYILDIGPETIKLFAHYIKKAQTIIWNGPLGLFENEHYRFGTMAIGRTIASHSRGRAFGVVGGGETIEALKMTKMENYIDWVSTGGGAMLSYLGGEKMPGLEWIIKN